MNLKPSLLLGGLLTFLATTAMAGYTIQRIDGGPDTLVQGRSYAYRLTSNPPIVNRVRLEVTGPGAPGVEIDAAGAHLGGNLYQPVFNPSDPLTHGTFEFLIRFNTGGAAALLTATNVDDINVSGSVSFNIQKFPTTYSITPFNPSPTAGVPFLIDVEVRNTDGTVTAYEDGVTIFNTHQGRSYSISVPAGSFVNGYARNVSVTIEAARLSDRSTELVIEHNGAPFYNILTDSDAPLARLTTPPIPLRPVAYDHIVMLFPGEVLIPGQGKDPSGINAQVAGIEVPEVLVYAVDRFNNPTDQSIPNIISFQPQADPESNLPAPTPMPASGILRILNTAPIPFEFLSVKTHDITAYPDGSIPQSSLSQVPVTQGPVSSYHFVVNPPANFDTDTSIQVQIEALNGLGVRDTAVDGVLPGAYLTAQRSIGLEEHVEWVDTNSGTDIPDNMSTVSFVDGLATIDLQVTIAATSLQLHFVEGSRETVSSQFNVGLGAVARVHFTIRGREGVVVGELFSPGIYPGNSGVPPANVQVGENVIVEAYVTDRRWNIISDGRAFNIQLQLVPETNRFIEVDYPGGISPALFDVSGRFVYDPLNSIFDQFTVRFRTAGLQRLVASSPGFPPNTQFSTQINVRPGAYNKLVIVAPGETLLPGTFPVPAEFEDGKASSPTARAAGVPFSATIYAVDQYFNPVAVGPYPRFNMTFDPAIPGNFVTGAQPFQMFGSALTLANRISLETGANVTVRDAANGAIFQTVAIPTRHGPIHHYVLLVDATNQPFDESNYEAGEFTRVRMVAQDAFGNQVLNYNNNVNLLAVNSGPGSMQPEVQAVAGGQAIFDLRVYAAGTNKIRMSQGGIISVTDEFDVRANDDGYEQLVLILPGETLKPGLVASGGKQGTPTPVRAGAMPLAIAYATDRFFNSVVPASPTRRVHFQSNLFATYAPQEEDIRNVMGIGLADTNIRPRSAGTHIITLRDVNNPAIGISISTLAVTAFDYHHLQLIAPGEVPVPGSDLPNQKDSSGILEQEVATPFTVQIRAVDEFGNLVLKNGGNIRLHSNVPEAVFIPLNDVDTPTSDPRPFANGLATRDVIIGVGGQVELNAFDDLDAARLPGPAELTIKAGPVYVFTTPAQVTASQNFNVNVQLQDSSGTPVVGYNEPIFLVPVFETNENASGTFGLPPEGTPMLNGNLSLNLNYAYVERIKIKLYDNFGRVAFSNPITVIPSGLRYEIVTPDQAIVGPPTSFSVLIRLLENNTGTLVRSPDYNHTVSVNVISADTTTTSGIFSVTSARFNQGEAVFNQTYTKAENIYIQVRETTDINNDLDAYDPSESNSNIIDMNPDQYSKLIIMAPGEAHRPGVPASLGNPTGKSGTAGAQQVGISFLVQVLAVDQYWNHVTDGFNFSSTRMVFTSDDDPASLNPTNPTDQNTPLTDRGEKGTFLKLYNHGNVKVRVADGSNPSIAPQEVVIDVGGVFYEVLIPAANLFAGPSSPFTMNVNLIDSNSGSVVTSANNVIYIAAFDESGTPATGVLGVTRENLSGGSKSILNQSYTKPQKVFFRITDDVGNVGQSAVVDIKSRAINYTITVPSRTVVNAPFNFTVRALDAFTGEENTSINGRNLVVRAFSITNGGAPVAGTFIPSNVILNAGAVVNAQAQYNLAEQIYIQITDSTDPTDPTLQPPTNPDFRSGPINVTPGALDTLDFADFEMQSNETRTITLVARDSYANLIPNQTLVLTVEEINPPGQMMMNGQANRLTGRTNSLGELSVTFSPSEDAYGPVRLLIVDGDRTDGFSHLYTINVLGLHMPPAAALGMGGDRIPVRSTVFLELGDIDTSDVRLQTFYRVDGRAWQRYNYATGILAIDPARGYDLFTETRHYQIEWYSQMCYDVACANPVSELGINGGPHVLNVLAYQVENTINGYPSPFNPKRDTFITIQYPVSGPSSDEIDIYDLFGQLVWQTRVDAMPTTDPIDHTFADHNKVLWTGVNEDGTTVANGGYIVRVKVGATGEMFKTKILVVK